MNRFLFVTHLTPVGKRSPLRNSLVKLYFQSLLNQDYSNWNAVLFGEPEVEDPRLHYFPLPDVSTTEKHAIVLKHLQSERFRKLADEAQYIVKLDDDDMISRTVLSALKTFDGDLYYDAYHTFIDASSGTITQQQRLWVASTCVHRKSCALDVWNGQGASDVGNLLYSDHSKAWHVYYQNKMKVTASREEPCYLRVLSPTSITAGSAGTSGFNAEQRGNYYSYLEKFGDWRPVVIKGFDGYPEELAAAWQRAFNAQQTGLPSFRKNWIARLKSRLRKPGAL